MLFPEKGLLQQTPLHHPAGGEQGARDGEIMAKRERQHPLAQGVFTGVSPRALSPGTRTQAGLLGENSPWRRF